jgi:CDP-4-dehydro-6-deoxyglucose reductase/3-phenylpropionate/trans-cinnamate dioxygenase ferredoxin reductase subunit
VVALDGTDIAFPCAPQETILEAAERAGIGLPYSCRRGVCSSCEAVLVSGSAAGRGRSAVRGPVDGLLLCQASPASDVVIRPKRVHRQEPQARRTRELRVHRVTRPSKDVVVLRLRLPNGHRARFTAGQYTSVLMDDGESRTYSLANPPHENDMVELHVRVVPGGRFSDVELRRLQPGATLRVELPYGEFCLREDSDKPVVLVATGTGFAPVKSILEDQLRRGGKRRIHFYWGGRTPQDLYLRDLPARWATEVPWLSFTAVVSQPSPDWRERVGRVHRQVLADYPDLSDHEVYVCGNPAMASAARHEFVSTGGLDPRNFYCDAFVATGQTADP